MTTTIPTAREIETALEGYGLAERTVRAVLRVSAPARHEARVAAARSAAHAAAAELSEASGYGRLVGPATIAALVELEIRGCGGPQGCGLTGPIDRPRGCRTSQRAPWASGLGRGRWAAGDGAAWQAALVDLLGRLLHEASPDATPGALLVVAAGDVVIFGRRHLVLSEHLQLRLDALPDWLRGQLAAHARRRVRELCAEAPLDADALACAAGLLEAMEPPPADPSVELGP